jgi:hypothetical protein
MVLVTTNAWFLPELTRLVKAPDGTFDEPEWRRRARRWEVLMLALAFPLVQALLTA